MSNVTTNRRGGEPKPRSIRFTVTEIAEIRTAAAEVYLGWTTFTRRAALTAARRQLQPATVEVGAELVPLTESTPEVP